MGSRLPFLLALGLGACAGGQAHFGLRSPVTRDTDLQSVNIPCHVEPSKKDPRHVSCAPKVYVSPLIWDGLDNSVTRPMSDALAFRATTEAVNANSLDEVADSAWFTNRIGAHPMSIDELRRGACHPS